MPPGDAPAVKTRKPHKKSRSGCRPCKARHVKCDEQKPTCLQCEKYGSNCEYPRAKSASLINATTPSPAPLNTPPSTQSVGFSRPNDDSAEIRDSIADISNLRLLHHFTTVTAQTLAHQPDVTDIFSHYIPKIAFENTFLLHAILSLAALHLSRSESGFRAEHLLQARRHHQLALIQFRSEVKDVTESNLHAVLSFNLFLFPYSCAISASCEGLEDAFESIFSNLLMTRMVGPLIQVSGLYNTMKNSEFGRIMPKDVDQSDWSKVEAPVETELVQLRKFSEVIHHIYPPEINEAYRDAIKLLEVLYERVENLSNPPSDSIVRIWIHFIPSRFIELLSERQPGALIIFAHYGVILGKARHYWFLEDIDELILSVADAFVPTEWKNWLDWPKEQIRGYRTPYSQPT